MKKLLLISLFCASAWTAWAQLATTGEATLTLRVDGQEREYQSTALYQTVQDRQLRFWMKVHTFVDDTTPAAATNLFGRALTPDEHPLLEFEGTLPVGFQLPVAQGQVLTFEADGRLHLAGEVWPAKLPVRVERRADGVLFVVDTSQPLPTLSNAVFQLRTEHLLR